MFSGTRIEVLACLRPLNSAFAVGINVSLPEWSKGIDLRSTVVNITRGFEPHS